MIVSMTGFGDAACERDGTSYAVEVRSLNNRYYKATIKLPDELAGLEPQIDSLLREKLGRGSITFVLKVKHAASDVRGPVNTDLLRVYLEQLRPFESSGRVIDLASLLQAPGVCEPVDNDPEALVRHGQVVCGLAREAMERLLAMRRREGQALFDELDRQIATISTHLELIAARAPLVLDEYHRRIQLRVRELLAKAELRVQEPDLIKEVAVFAERSDISEELQRLGHHLRQFRQGCVSGEHAGRKLDFITQEMLREANTIASKSADAEIAGHIVEIKGCIDRLKEQVQNVE